MSPSLSLVEENAILKERIAMLERRVLVDRTFQPPLEWSLTRSEVTMFQTLVTLELATKDAMLTALYSDRAGDEPEPRIVDVYLCKMRKKLRTFGVEIRTLWGRGYCLDPAVRAQFKVKVAA